MKIGNIEFKNNVFLAPMAGVTDISFRGLCKEQGCGLVYTEMVSAKALYYGSDNTKKLLRISEEEKPVAVQIFGNDSDIMAKVVEENFNSRDDICIIDVNMGCPAPKIVKNGERIGQVVFIPYVNVDFVEVDNLDLTERGDKGFGSTGV